MGAEKQLMIRNTLMGVVHAGRTFRTSRMGAVTWPHG